MTGTAVDLAASRSDPGSLKCRLWIRPNATGSSDYLPRMTGMAADIAAARSDPDP